MGRYSLCYIPFDDESYDVICTNSFHHYPNPQKFFDSVKHNY